MHIVMAYPNKFPRFIIYSSSCRCCVTDVCWTAVDVATILPNCRSLGFREKAGVFHFAKGTRLVDSTKGEESWIPPTGRGRDFAKGQDSCQRVGVLQFARGQESRTWPEGRNRELSQRVGILDAAKRQDSPMPPKSRSPGVCRSLLPPGFPLFQALTPSGRT